MKKGKLIVVDGTDGAGKTTQINLLIHYFRQKNIDFEVISFPQYGKNEYANQIEDYLDGKLGNLKEVDPYFIAKAYASDRKTSRDLIKGWLEKGKLVIANRYVSSSKAHLGANLPAGRREEFFKWLDELEYMENGMPREDLTILLVVDPKIGQANVSTKHDPDIHEDNLNHLKMANQIYLELAKDENWKIINCMEDGNMRKKMDIQKDLLESISVVLSPK